MAPPVRSLLSGTGVRIKAVYTGRPVTRVACAPGRRVTVNWSVLYPEAVVGTTLYLYLDPSTYEICLASLAPF